VKGGAAVQRKRGKSVEEEKGSKAEFATSSLEAFLSLERTSGSRGGGCAVVAASRRTRKREKCRKTVGIAFLSVLPPVYATQTIVSVT
jgi:hypothetical protein